MAPYFFALKLHITADISDSIKKKRLLLRVRFYLCIQQWKQLSTLDTTPLIHQLIFNCSPQTDLIGAWSCNVFSVSPDIPDDRGMFSILSRRKLTSVFTPRTRLTVSLITPRGSVMNNTALSDHSNSPDLALIRSRIGVNTNSPSREPATGVTIKS